MSRSRDEEESPDHISSTLFKLHIVWSRARQLHLGQLLAELVRIDRDMNKDYGAIDVYRLKDDKLNSILDMEIQRIVDETAKPEEEILTETTAQILAFEECNERK